MFGKVFLVFLFSFSLLNAQSFSKSATLEPVLVQSGKQKAWCPVCGMNIGMFYKTSHTAKLDNHKDRQYCSMRCLVVDMKKHNIDIKTVKVVDAFTQKLIIAKDAFYVIGSTVKGTMSKVSKLAFFSKDEAEKFAKIYKGKVVDFNTALESAKKSLKTDIAMVTKKKKKKVYPMGKKIYTKMCNQDISLDKYKAINELKSSIRYNHLCKNLKEKQLQAVSLYLWEVKKLGEVDDLKITIKVTKDEKCPICGMFVYKYPRWATQIFYADKHYSFDGVKDLMKYYFKHKKGINKILVTDYYSQKAIDATNSYFVMGSDVYGPMGDELIPFLNKDDAENFLLDHKATNIIKFLNITEDTISKLDE